jgi:anti-sigma factor RsiW
MLRVPGELSCKEVVELINDWLEGRLPLAERTDFELHLAFCEGCAEYLRQLRQTKKAAERLGEEELPDQTRDALLAAFRNWKGRRK